MHVRINTHTKKRVYMRKSVFVSVSRPSPSRKPWQVTFRDTNNSPASRRLISGESLGRGNLAALLLLGLSRPALSLEESKSLHPHVLPSPRFLYGLI